MTRKLGSKCLKQKGRSQKEKEKKGKIVNRVTERKRKKERGKNDFVYTNAQMYIHVVYTNAQMYIHFLYIQYSKRRINVYTKRVKHEQKSQKNID